jgi:hypothetical protein
MDSPPHAPSDEHETADPHPGRGASTFRARGLYGSNSRFSVDSFMTDRVRCAVGLQRVIEAHIVLPPGVKATERRLPERRVLLRILAAGQKEDQHVTWRMAFVPWGFLANASMASSVGKISRSTFRRCASRFTCGHHRKRSISSRADYEALALPGHLFLDRHRGMSELLAEFF